MRGWRDEDHDALGRITRDPRRGAGLGKPAAARSGTRPGCDMAVLAGHWVLKGFGHWVLEELDSGELVGRAGLYYPPDWPGLEVGWTVAREHWGKGYAPEAGRAACEWAHEALGARPHPQPDPPVENANSIRVAEKLGETARGPPPVRAASTCSCTAAICPRRRRVQAAHDDERGDRDDPLLRREEEAAAREAGGIGGREARVRGRGGPSRERGGPPADRGRRGRRGGLRDRGERPRGGGQPRREPLLPRRPDFGDEESAGDADAVSGEADEIERDRRRCTTPAPAPGRPQARLG